VQNPFAGVRALNFQLSYCLSRFENSGGNTPVNAVASDQDIGVSAVDNSQPNRYSVLQHSIEPSSFRLMDLRT